MSVSGRLLDPLDYFQSNAMQYGIKYNGVDIEPLCPPLSASMLELQRSRYTNLRSASERPHNVCHHMYRAIKVQTLRTRALVCKQFYAHIYVHNTRYASYNVADEYSGSFLTRISLVRRQLIDFRVLLNLISQTIMYGLCKY